MAPLPSSDMKPGAAMQPLPGIKPILMGKTGQVTSDPASGELCIESSWPGQMRGVWKNPKRFIDTYYSDYPGYYFTGDGAQRDEQGDWWITGRVDDVLNVSGHRLGTSEIESALVAHPSCSEAAVIGRPHEIKGEAIVAFIQLNSAYQDLDTARLESLRTELLNTVRKELSAIAKPDNLIFIQDLPKTRSGKIMRRILRKMAAGEVDDFGDTSTLADASVVEQLLIEVPQQLNA